MPQLCQLKCERPMGEFSPEYDHRCPLKKMYRNFMTESGVVSNTNSPNARQDHSED